MIKKLNAPWINDIKKLIENKISDSIMQLKEEAEYDHNINLSNEKFLYERFKDNIENKLVFGNYEVLKYFYRIMKIKLYRLMLGRNTFNAHDKEMYNYFVNIQVNEKTKCKPALLKIKSGTEIDENNIIYMHNKYMLTYVFETNNNSSYMDILNVSYFNHYINCFRALDDMIRNVKMQQKLNFNLFSDDIFDILKIYGLTDKKIINILCDNCKEIKNQKYKSFYQDEADLLQLFDSFIRRDDEYQKLSNKINLRIKELYKEFVKTEEYNYFPDNLKEKMKNTYN
ncbi:MAG TPA: hypothetical protein PLC00_07635 [Bacteroidales bacterium]|nr:hypothetical protein [Bacteroidales bacterium]